MISWTTHRRFRDERTGTGGFGDSGSGRGHGAEGILEYTDLQTIAVQRLLPIAPLPGMSEQTWAKTMTVALWAMRRLGLK